MKNRYEKSKHDLNNLRQVAFSAESHLATYAAAVEAKNLELQNKYLPILAGMIKAGTYNAWLDPRQDFRLLAVPTRIEIMGVGISPVGEIFVIPNLADAQGNKKLMPYLQFLKPLESDGHKGPAFEFVAPLTFDQVCHGFASHKGGVRVGKYQDLQQDVCVVFGTAVNDGTGQVYTLQMDAGGTMSNCFRMRPVAGASFHRQYTMISPLTIPEACQAALSSSL
jgi:hypothetical protein